ncbi:ATP-binding protein [Streptomyces phaeochromogenes]|uniref:ATP-binding protein n=1 Tax=Streptomyces phaeochromogenes TaxID=1923 RepID=UPI00386FBCC2|nr:ATP-binding protein [Streptomyces phaeochromogenes]
MPADYQGRRADVTANDAVNPIPLLAAALRLTAVPTAVAVSRMFVRHTLSRWQMEEQTDTAALIMSELVTNAVRASGITETEPKSWQITAEHVIGIQLRALEASLFVEVWDRSEGEPVKKNPTLEATSGRGLLLVDALAKRWNIYRSPVGGKVVWAELPLGVPVESPPFDQDHAPLILHPSIRAPRGPVEDQARTALFEHLMETTASVAAASRGNDAI